MNSTIKSSKIIFNMGKRNQTLSHSAWRKKVDKTYAKTRLLKLLIASQPILYFYITDILGEKLFLYIFYQVTNTICYEILTNEIVFLKPVKCGSTHTKIFQIWKKNVIKFVSYLKSHITLDLHTTIFKHSSVASDCGTSFLPKCTGEDRENSGKLDLDV